MSSAQLASGVSVGEAAAAYLDTLRVPTTRRVYAQMINKTAGALGPDRALADVEDLEVGAVLQELWGEAAPNTWKSRLSAVSSWLKWCREAGYPAPAVPRSAPARPADKPAKATRLHSRAEIDLLTSRSDIPLRETTLWRMLYDTAAHVVEVLDLNIEDLDRPNRSAQVRISDAELRRRAEGHAGDATFRPVSWGPATDHFLTRHLEGRRVGPVFVATLRPRRARRLTERDVDPKTGFARLTPAAAGHWLDRYTATAGRGTGWTLHELRTSSLLYAQLDQAIDDVDGVWQLIGGLYPDLAHPVTEGNLPAVATAARDLEESDHPLATAGRPLARAIAKISRAAGRARAPSLSAMAARQVRRDLARAKTLSEADARKVQAAAARTQR